MPIGKESGPNCPLDGFRQFEKLFIHAFHLFSGLIHPGGALGSGRFCGAARQGVRLVLCGVVVRGGESVQIIGAVNRAQRFAVAINNVIRAIIGGFHDRPGGGRPCYGVFAGFNRGDIFRKFQAV